MSPRVDVIGRTVARAEPAPPPSVLVLPGLHGSGPLHWQSIWERRRGELRRVEQASWSQPRLGDWAATLDRAVMAAPAPVILVAHSLACALVAHWARAGATERVAAALLVAPADAEALGNPELRSFVPMPLERLPFESWVVASEDDPCVTPARAQEFAGAWGARHLAAGRCGHLNVESGHGAWPQGEALLVELERAAMAPTRRFASTGPSPSLRTRVIVARERAYEWPTLTPRRPGR